MHCTNFRNFLAKCQEILSRQHFFKVQQFYLELWPCDFRINRDHLLPRGIHCTKFGNFQAESSVYISVFMIIIYSYWLGSRTTGFGQQIRSRVKQNCCCTRSQSITVLLYTFIFSTKLYSLFPLTYSLLLRHLNIPVRQVRESGRRLRFVRSISRDLLNQWK